MAIKHMLIDLGGVLYEIDVATTLRKYQTLQAPEAQPLDFSISTQSDIFSRNDRGELTGEAFAEALKAEFCLEASAAQILEIWGSLLKGLYPGREAALARLAATYDLALLSNTNAFHHAIYAEECAPMFSHMKALFFSFEMGLRKPDPEIFTTALAKMGWKAPETLFVDDSVANLKGAQVAGLQTYRIGRSEDFDALLRAYV
jgi:glucose-1-phosphatase